MMRNLHFALCLALIAGSGARLPAAGPGTVTGWVRDTAGVPQVGAEVQLLRPDLTVIASVYTNAAGRYTLRSVFPGKYAVKALGATFLPSMRENVRVRASAVVNLTLNTLYEVMQWLPAEPRSAAAQHDDWEWTLRSAANRPLLRWLEDGPLVVVTDGSGAAPRLKARLLASGQQGAFGESGERISVAIEDTPSDSRELLARVDFDPSSDGAIESMLGFRQDLGFAGSVQSVAAIAQMPEVGEAGLSEASVRTWEQIHLGDLLEVEVGADQVLARKNGARAQTVAAVLPFASLGWRPRGGPSRIAYRMTTALPDRSGAAPSQAQAWMPAMALRDGSLRIEQGLHQEVGWERQTEVSGFSFLFYADQLENPAVEAMTRMDGDLAPSEALLDRDTDLARAAAPDFSATGFLATFERRLGQGNRMRLSYANGSALVAPAQTQRASDLAQAVRSLRPRHAQMYSLALSGTLDGTGTRWRASYRWQPRDTITEVAPFAVDATEPFLNVHLRQPIRIRRDGLTGLEALIDVRNLLADGYRPFLLSDGSLLLFAQDQRSIRAGLAFNF